MRKSVIAGLALWRPLRRPQERSTQMLNYPWWLMGDTRGYECVFSSREQCMQDGRNRGFGGQCIQNPAYKSGKPTASQTARPSQAVSGPATCTELKLACLSFQYWPDPRFHPFRQSLEAALKQDRPEREKNCNFAWEQCTKSGWWEGGYLHAHANAIKS